MKVTFKKYMAEDGASQALEIAANFLNTQINKLQLIGGELEDQVLETGKEVKKQFVKMVHGNMIVRLYKALGKMFARVEFPDGENKTYAVKTA